MKICFLLGGFFSGGVGRVVSIIANELSELDNYEIHCVTLRPAEKKEIYYLKPQIRRAYLTEDRRSVKYILLDSGIKFKKYINSNSIDIIVACGNIFYPIALLGKKKRVKIICWEHSNVFTTTDNDGQTILRWFASKLSNYIVTLTDCDMNGFKSKFTAKKVMRIYNPIDPRIEAVNSEEFASRPMKIISVGRFCYQKNFECIPEIGKLLIKYSRDWDWDIYGTGETLEVVVQKVKSYGLQDRIHFKGQVNDLYSRYKDYGLIVMTSRYEGFPMALLEATKNGLPMVSFNIKTGPDEIIEDGSNGYLVKEHDYECMARSINAILTDEQKRLGMSLSSLKKAEQFEVSKIVPQWVRLFENLVNDK